MSEERTIGIVDKNPFTQIRVTVKTYEDRNYLHVRQWVRSTKEEDYKPTSKGVALEYRQAPELCQVFESLSRELREVV